MFELRHNSSHHGNPRRLGRFAFVVACGLLLTTAASAKPKSSPTATAEPSPARTATILQAYGQLPLSFEANQGQTSAPVKFLAGGNGYRLLLTGQEAVLALTHSPVGTVQPRSQRLSANGIAPATSTGSLHGAKFAKAGEPFQQDVVRMQLARANMHSNPIGMDKLPGVSNYFLGNDPAQWHTHVPSFGKVRYPQVYPGIDLVYYGNQQHLEYDFVVAPGADPRAIQLHFAGARKLNLDKQGNLAIRAENGSIVFQRPLIYQTQNGSRVSIAGKFTITAHNSVGFTLGRYDHTKSLVIDPILAYSTYFGGSTADFVVAVASDASGNAYLTGLTASSDFPLTAGAFQSINYATPSNQVSTAFISKLNASGTALLYSTFIGGVGVSDTLHNQGDYGKAIAVDASGNAYITGYTYSADFPVTSGALQTTNKAATGNLATGFVTKLNPSGTGLVYSTYLGGSLLDQLTGITLDSNGDAFIAGVSASNDFPVTSGVVQTVNKSYDQDGFNYVISKVNPTGSALIYSTYLGGTRDNASGDGSIYWTNPIVVDKSGNAYVAGFTTSGNFPVTSGAYQTTNNSGYTVTVSKLNPTATALLYSTYLGGASNGSTGSIAEGLAVDSAGNAYVAGYTSETTFPVTKGAFQATNKADTDTTTSPYSNENGFVTKINPTGTALVYSTYLGGSTGPWGGDQIYDLALDSAGDVYVTGSAMSDDFPVTSDAYQPKNAGATHCCDYLTYTSNAFLTEFNPAGSALVYSTYLGGSGTQNPDGPGGYGDTAYGLTLGKNGNVYLVGFSTSSNFPVTAGAFDTTYKTAENIGFVANFDLGTAPATKDTETTLTASGNPVVPGTSITFTAAVAAASGTTIPTGNIVFSVDEATVATVALNASGNATYSTSTLAPGAHYVLANYVGSSTFDSSGDGSNEYIVPIIPVVSPAAGTYTSQQTVTITDGTSGASLYYTNDGSTPTVFSTPYTAPIPLNTSKTITAVAVSGFVADSADVSAAYTIIGSPVLLAGPATALSTTGATLNAFVNTLGLSGTFYVRYGSSSTALTQTSASKTLSATNSRVTIATAVASLTTKTTYYFQSVVTTAGGTTTGPVLSFTTN